MAKQVINIGTTANDGTGSTIRAGGDLINDNFTEIYTALGDGTTITFDVTGATNGQALVFNSASGKFKPGTASVSSDFIIAGDGGANQTISSNDTLTVAGGTGITTTGVATDQLSIAIDGTVATLSGSQELTNKTIAAGSNTITGSTTSNLSGSAAITSGQLAGSIANAKLANSKITIQGSDSSTDDVSLGETLILAGSVTSAVSGNTITLTGFSGGTDLDQANAVVRDVGYISHRSSSVTPTKTLTVTVAAQTTEHYYNGTGSSNKYVIDGDQGPALQLAPGTYRFDQADSSNGAGGGHPLRFYLDAAKAEAYTTGVTTNGSPGSAGAYTQIVIDKDTPLTLYYQCSSHAHMGHVIQVLGGFSNGDLTYSNGTATGDGSTTTTTINAGRSVNDVIVTVNGLIFVPTTDYTISGTTLTFAAAPGAGNEISIRYLPLSGSATYTNTTATGDGSTTTVTIAAGRTAADLIVTVNGVLMTPADDYSVSGTTLTFVTAPAASAEISIRLLRLN